MKNIIIAAFGMMLAGSAIAGDLPSTKEVLVTETSFVQNPWAFAPFVGANAGYSYAGGSFGSLGVDAGVQAKYVGVKAAYDYYGNFNTSTVNVVRVVPFAQYPLAYNVTPYVGAGVGYAWRNNGIQQSIYTAEAGLKYQFAAKTSVVAWYEYDQALDRPSKPDNAFKLGIRQSF